MNKLTELYLHGTNLYGSTPEQFTDKGSAHNYIDTYFDILKDLEHCKILEIGVRTGGSIWLWTKFLPSYEIWGIDILSDYFGNRPFVEELKNDSNVTTKWNRNSFDADSYKDLPKDFDLIIDDGDHSPEGINKTIVHAWLHLKEGGTYIIEDTQSEQAIEQVVNNIKELSPNSSIEVLRLLKQGDDNIIKIIKKEV